MKLHFTETPDRLKIGVLEWKDSVSYDFPILLVHGFSQNNLSWHGKNSGLAPKLAEKGFWVFAVDLRGSGYSRIKKLYYNYTFEDFVFRDIDSAINLIVSQTGSKKVVLAGHSLGGICSYTYASFFPHKVHAVITFGSPVYFGRGVPAMRIAGRFVGLMKKVPMSSLIYYFWPREVAMKILGFFGLFGVPLMKYRDVLKISPLYPSYTRNFESAWDFWEKLVKGFEFSSPRLLVQILLWVDQGKITSYDGRINYTEKFKEIVSPVFAIAGTLDKLAPPESVKPIIDIVSSKIKVYREYEAGHLDLIEGKLAKTKIADDVERFLKDLKNHD